MLPFCFEISEPSISYSKHDTGTIGDIEVCSLVTVSSKKFICRTKPLAEKHNVVNSISLSL